MERVEEDLDDVQQRADDLYAHLDEAEVLASQIPVWSEDEMEPRASSSVTSYR